MSFALGCVVTALGAAAWGAATGSSATVDSLVIYGLVLAFVVLAIIHFFKICYRRCPADQIMVVWNKGDKSSSLNCVITGGVFVWPIFNDVQYMSLEAIEVEIPLEGAQTRDGMLLNLPSVFRVGFSTDPVLMNNAAERLLMHNRKQIRELALYIILDQLRLVIASLSIEEINKDREKFMELINENVTQEINKVGLEINSVNIQHNGAA